jgi:calcium-dependent protein kinase
MKEELKEKNDNKLVGTVTWMLTQSYYIAPEIINGSYDERCDIWSAGVILYILVTAIPPFDGENDREIISAVKRGQYTFDIPEMKKVSSECKDLISKMLCPEN